MYRIELNCERLADPARLIHFSLSGTTFAGTSAAANSMVGFADTVESILEANEGKNVKN